MRRSSSVASICLLAGVAALFAGFGAVRPAAAEQLQAGVCATASQFFIADGLSGLQSPCTVAPGSLLVESLYLQDASRVGGTALAVYPLFRLRTGITKRLELTVDTPSQIAESGRAGIGLYPTTRLGFGVNYTLAQSDRLALALGAETLPPISHFATTQKQSKYALDVTGGYRLTPHLTLQAFASGESSSRSGFAHVFPSAALGAAYGVSSATQLSFDIGTRALARHANLQSFVNASAGQRLGKKMTFEVGVGTRFNPISNAKAHYLASGLTYRI